MGQIQDVVRPRDAARMGAPLATVASLRWKEGKKKEAVKMLEFSVAFLEKGGDGGFVKDSDLFVPYSNLSTMCKGLKDSANAAKFKKLAEQHAPQK